MHDLVNNKREDFSVPHRSMCTDCGISRTDNPQRCGKACQFIKPDYPGMESKVHGRARNADAVSDERFFGPFQSMHRCALRSPKTGAQWTGITTEIGKLLLQNGIVDAVVTVKPDPNDRWKPVPVIVTDPKDMNQCRGMRMGYAPVLSLIEPAIELGHTKIALIGIPCQVYALRALEDELGLEKLYVVGIPCSDNTSTENFLHFLNLLTDQPEDVNYLEFKADYHVEMRFQDGSRKNIPFLNLPISDLPPNFFPLTCQTCVDYTNSLSDITIGYMAGEGEQWAIVRNDRGRELLELLGDSVHVRQTGSSGNRKNHVAGFMKNVELSANGLPIRRMPRFVKPIATWLMPKIGPKGLEFARTRVEMKAIETILHLRKHAPARMKNMVPQHVWDMAAGYGLTKQPHENKEEPDLPNTK